MRCASELSLLPVPVSVICTLGNCIYLRTNKVHGDYSSSYWNNIDYAKYSAAGEIACHLFGWSNEKEEMYDMNSLHHNTQFILAVVFIQSFNSDSIDRVKILCSTRHKMGHF